MPIGSDLPPSLIEAAKIICEADTKSKNKKDQKEVQAAIKKELDKMGVDSPADLSEPKRKALFDKIDKMFVSDDEKSGKDVEPEDKATLKKMDEAAVPAMPVKTVDPVTERYYRVEVVNGVTGVGAAYTVAAANEKNAEEEVLFAAQDDPDLSHPPNTGGKLSLVVSGTTEISQEEFENDDEFVEI